MAESGGNESWDLDYDGWRETWHRSSAAGFDRIAVGASSFLLGRDDLTALRPRIADACPICSRALPQAFSHCFACGAKLHDAPAPAEPPQGAPNAGRPEAGLPRLQLADPGAAPERLALPHVGRRFALAVAGEPARLFAIDRDGGWAHAFDRRRNEWTRLFSVGENRLPERSWSLAAAAAGLVLPANGQLTTIDLTSGPLPRQSVTPLPPGDVCLGGPCIVLAEARVPVVRGGVLHLARRRMVRGGDWTFEAVRDAPAFDGDPDVSRAALSAPMATETGVSWAGQTGTVVAMLGDGGVLGPPAWRGWSAGFTPLLAHRPYADPEGGVWQFGTVPGQAGRRRFSFERIGSLSQTSQELLSGSVLASGVLACRLLTLRHRAWLEQSAYNRDLPGRADDFLVPVQAFGAENAVLLLASDRLAEFVNAGLNAAVPPIPASLRFYDGWQLHDLAVPVNLRSFTQIAAVVFDGQLIVYDSLENECWRWTLRPAA